MTITWPNAVSLLWRLEQEGVAIGARWDELAERARNAWGLRYAAFAARL